MNSKQRRSIWREHSAQIESLEFQYRVLSGEKPSRNVTVIVPKYLELLQRAVKARRQLKAETGNSKGWCDGDPISSFWSANFFAGNQRTAQQRAVLRQSKSRTSGLRANTIIFDEATTLQHGKVDDRMQSALISKAAIHAGIVGASVGAANTSSASAHRAFSRQADDQVDALVYLFRDHLDRNAPHL